jgi:hypothetical protein
MADDWSRDENDLQGRVATDVAARHPRRSAATRLARERSNDGGEIMTRRAFAPGLGLLVGPALAPAAMARGAPPAVTEAAAQAICSRCLHLFLFARAPRQPEVRGAHRQIQSAADHEAAGASESGGAMNPSFEAPAHGRRRSGRKHPEQLLRLALTGLKPRSRRAGGVR